MKGDYYRYLAEVAAGDAKQCKFSVLEMLSQILEQMSCQPNVYYFTSNH